MDYQKDKLGALWASKTSKGETMLSGTITLNGQTLKIVAFKNNKRPGKADPDFQVFKSKPREETPSFSDPLETDDIPF